MTRSKGSASSSELREAIATHDAAALARRQRDAARRAELEARLAEAEHRESIEAARADLLMRAGEEAAEADHLDALADALAAQLADADAAVGRLRRQRADLAAGVLRDDAEAAHLVASDPERAASLVSANAGRRAVGEELDRRIAAVGQQRSAILAGGAVEPEPEPDPGAVRVFHGGGVDMRAGTLDGLRRRAAWHREQAAQYRARAASDPLGELAELQAKDGVERAARVPWAGILPSAPLPGGPYRGLAVPAGGTIEALHPRK